MQTNSIQSTTSACPRWAKCSAPKCPLDAGWASRKMAREDSTCYYLLEAVKPNAEANFRVAGREQLFEAISKVIPDMIAQTAHLKSRAEQARKTGSRLANFCTKAIGRAMEPCHV